MPEMHKNLPAYKNIYKIIMQDEVKKESMRPEMYGEYMGIKKSFIRKGRGILDETRDVGIAAVVADGFTKPGSMRI